MDKFKNTYRIASARATFWDYGSDGVYFVTICTQNRQHFFGEVVNGVMELSALGGHAHECWEAIPEHFPFVRLGAFVVMPNHVHGMIIIDKNNIRDDVRDDIRDVVETQNFASLPVTESESLSKNQFGPQSKNLASIIRGYKIGVTKHSKQLNTNFAWQPRYHDHIVRDDRAYQNIRNYILNNPKNWKEDKFYTT